MDKEEQEFRLLQYKHMRKSLQNDMAVGKIATIRAKMLGKVKF